MYRLRVPRGQLITIEGIDGAGKSTLAHNLARELRARNIAVELLREPGGTRLAERIRSLLDDPELPSRPGPRAETLLFAAARADLVATTIEPLLASGTWALIDRFSDSTLAYQGGGRNLGVDAVRALDRFAAASLVPDRTLLLALDPDAARERQQARGAGRSLLEREDAAFFARVTATYEQLARSQPERIRKIDARLGPDAVLREALAALADLLAPAAANDRLP